MSTTRFKTTLDAIKGGVQNFSVEKGISNIEGWEEYLSKHDNPGVQKVVQDLGKLKKMLSAEKVSGEEVKKLVSKLGKDTVAVAGEDQSSNATHIKELGEALSNAAQ